MSIDWNDLRLQFEQFKKHGIELIKQIVSEEWQESLTLEFKTIEGNSAPITKGDRKNLAEALSGFANSEGGIIVWGVDARSRDSSDPDTAKDLCPIKNLARFSSELQRDTPHVVSPAIISVEHYPIQDLSDDDVGYVVSFIPKSQGEPHMARAQGQHRFYYRSGSSFLPMESFMLADRYSRRPQPVLELRLQVEGGAPLGRPPPPSLRLRTLIGIKNTGLGIAIYPALVIYDSKSCRLDHHGLDDRGNAGLPERVRSPDRPEEARRVFAGGVNDAIHPGTTLYVVSVTCDVNYDAKEIPDLIIRYELYCQGFSKSDKQILSLFEELRRIRGY